MSGATESQYKAVGSAMSLSLEKTERRSRRSKWIVVGSVIALLVLIGVGVGVGVTVAKNNKGGGSSSSNSGVEGAPEQSDPDDPSTFVSDPKLRKALYGLAYTPEGSLVPACGNSLEAVIADVQIMSQLTTRIRLYGADCNQTALVLEAIKQTKVDMEVYLGNYPVQSEPEAYERQRDTIKEALETYGSDHVAGITVGNEFILNAVTGAGGSDPNSAAGNTAGAILVENIQDTRDMLSSMNLDIPVGNSDAGSFFNDRVLAAIDYGLSNVHPWFANVTIQQAADWTTNFFDEQNVQPAALLPNKPQMFIAETGWPTDSKDEDNRSNGAAVVSEENLQIFMDDFVCQANDAGIGYFFFEFTDEQWKDDLFGGVEGHWGLFNQDRTLKDVVIPDCISP